MKIRMKSFGHKVGPYKVPEIQKGGDKVSYPTLHLSSRHAGDLSHHQRGDSVVLMFKGKVAGTRDVDTEYESGQEVTFHLTHGHIQTEREMKKTPTPRSTHDAAVQAIRAIHASKGKEA